MILWLLLGLFLLYWFYSWRQVSRLPTPRYYLPFVGHIEILFAGKSNPVDHMWNLYKKYSRGGILSIELFGLPQVMIGDYEVLKRVYNHPAAQNRALSADPNTCPLTNKLKEDRNEKGAFKGLLFSQGQSWTEQRRFALRTLRDFGFGKSSMDEMIQDEVKQLMVHLNKIAKGPLDLTGVFNLPILNALWRVCTSESYEYDDPKLTAIINKMTEFFKLAGDKSVFLIIKFPWLFRWFPTLLKRDVHISINQDLMQLIEKSIAEHQETLDMNDPRDFIDSYLVEVANMADKNSSFYGKEGIRSLTHTMMDLFMAGSETTSTTLTWAVLYMVREPQVQAKVQAEIDNIVGRSRMPCSADRASMPYTEAVIHEIMRCGNIVPFGVEHSSSEPITVAGGITLPAHTMIVPLMINVLKGDHWQDGLKFNPDRFLKDGCVKKDDHLIPFSIGKRQCLGETLAKVEMFLFFTGLLQNFSILPEVKGVLPPDEGADGVTQLPLPFKAILQPRTNDQ